MPQTRFEFAYGANERRLFIHALAEAKKMVSLIGGRPIRESVEPGGGGTAVHEMGGARMGRDPSSSVLNGHSQAHDVANLFVTDRAAMASTACQNPSLTYMAFTARAAAYAVDRLKGGAI